MAFFSIVVTGYAYKIYPYDVLCSVNMTTTEAGEMGETGIPQGSTDLGWDEAFRNPDFSLTLQEDEIVYATLSAAYPELSEFAHGLVDYAQRATESPIQSPDIPNGKRAVRTRQKVMRSVKAALPSDEKRRLQAVDSITYNQDVSNEQLENLFAELGERVVERVSSTLHVKGMFSETVKQDTAVKVSEALNSIALRREFDRPFIDWSMKIAERFQALPVAEQLDHAVASIFVLSSLAKKQEVSEEDSVNPAGIFITALMLAGSGNPLVVLDERLRTDEFKPALAQVFIAKTKGENARTAVLDEQLRFASSLLPDLPQDMLERVVAANYQQWPASLKAEYSYWLDSRRQDFGSIGRFTIKGIGFETVDLPLDKALSQLELCFVKSLLRTRQDMRYTSRGAQIEALTPAQKLSTSSELRRIDKEFESLDESLAKTSLSGSVEVVPVTENTIIMAVSNGVSRSFVSVTGEGAKDHFSEYAALHKGDAKIAEDLEACREYLKTLTFGRNRGIQPRKYTAKINDKELKVFSMKPTDVPGLSTRSNTMQRTRILFAHDTDDGGVENVIVLAVIHRDDVSKWDMANRFGSAQS